MPKITLEILVGEKGWRRMPRLAVRLQKAADAAFAHLPERLQFSSQVTVLLANDAAMKKLNRDFLWRDRPTNVLSFPQFEPAELTKMGKKTPTVPIGDIVLGYQYIVAEAKKNNKILINHVTHLILHGLLHLFGYDHQVRAKAIQMERLEKRILAGLGLPDPYVPKKREPKAC
jgi:probable rRNA maturation factor